MNIRAADCSSAGRTYRVLHERHFRADLTHEGAVHANTPHPRSTGKCSHRRPEMQKWSRSRSYGTISHVECRRRPTLPHPDECSTIGAGGLSFRVRDGTGRSPLRQNHRQHYSPIPAGRRPVPAKPLKPSEPTRVEHQPHPTDPPKKGGFRWCGLCAQGHTVDANNLLWQALGLLVPVNSTPHRASISGLSTQSSTGSLNHARWWETSSWNELPA
jgi:hypothetical protein